MANNIKQDIYIHQDLNGNEIIDATLRENVILNSGTSDRPTPNIGEKVGLLHYDSDIDRVIVWDGTQWRSIKYLDDSSSSSSTLTVQDYTTGASFSNITNMIFRGNTVTVPGGTANGVLTTSGATNSVTVWIPAPDYVDYFNQGSNTIPDVNTQDRVIADSLGTYNLGSYSAGYTHSTIDYTNNGILNYSVTEFALINNTSTTLTLSLLDDDDSTVIETITYTLNSTGSTSNNGLTINVTQLDPNQDRFKASANFQVDLNNANLIPLGGKFSVVIEHNNIGDPSYTSVPKKQIAMYDRDTDDGSTSTALINGSVSLSEQSPTLYYLSGVAYYDNGSSFEVNVIDMDNLNEITYPTGNQLNLNFSTNSGINDTGIVAGGSGYVSWSNDYNVQNVDYIQIHNISSSNLVTPGTNDNNELNVSNTTNVNAILNDWVSNVDNQVSPDYNWLILSKSSVSDRNTEDFNDESRRLSVFSALFSSTESAFDSTVDLTTGNYEYELQQIQGSSPSGGSKLVYPKVDFSTWQPEINITNTIDYSTASTASVSIDVINSRSALTTDTFVYNDYRWYLRKFETPGIANVQANGTFEFDTDFVEKDLDTKNDDTPGDGNLLLFMGLTNNTVPSGWYDLSRINTSPDDGGIRVNSTGGGGNFLDENSKISWNTGTLNGWRAYLLVGVKNTSTNNEISEISIEDGNWD